MLKQQEQSQLRRKKRAFRVRKKLKGTSLCPRICIIKSNQHIHAQLIDDEVGFTLASVATFAKEFKNTEFNRKNKASAKKLGQRLAELAREKNISKAIYDRGSAKYHGILAEFADGARESGLKF